MVSINWLNEDNQDSFYESTIKDEEKYVKMSKKYSKQQLALAMQLLGENSYTEVEKMTGISKSTLTRYKRKYTSQH